MGGLIALEFLMTFPEFGEKVPLIVTYATPYQGSQVADLGQKVLRNPAVAAMVPLDPGNTYLIGFQACWRAAKDRKRLSTRVECAYEKIPVPGIEQVIVPFSSATGLCDGVSDAVAEDHIGISKPSSRDHPSYKLLAVALRQLPPLDVSAIVLRRATASFEVYAHDRVVDLAQWKYVPDGERDKKLSRIVFTDRLTVKRLKESHGFFTLRHATTGKIPIDFRSDTHRIDPRETGEQPQGGMGALIRIFDVAFDVRNQPLGQWFDIHLESVYWNAMNDYEKAWTGFPILYKTNRASLEIRFPSGKPIRRWERREGARDTTTSDLVNDTAARYSEGRTITWVIENPNRDWVYKVLWQW